MQSKLLPVIFTFLHILYFGTGLHAQSPPVVAPDRWVLDKTLSDEFNGSALDSSKWWPIEECDSTNGIRHGDNWSTGAFFRRENVSVNNGNLVLTVDYNPDSLSDSFPCVHHHLYPYYSGGVMSVLTDGGPSLEVIGKYSYGYYEMRAKLPGYYDSNHQSIGYGFWPTFWFFYQYWENGCIKKHDEVDILEPDPSQYYDARTNVVGWHDEDDSCRAPKIGEDSVRSVTPLFAEYHKYAVELFPSKIVFYFDDRPFFSADSITSPLIAHSLNFAPFLDVVMSIQMWDNPRALPDAPFPEYMYVDYFRYYHLNPDYGHNVLFQNSPNPAGGIINIGYNIDDNSSSMINVYNVLGSLVKSFQLPEKGKSNVSLNGSELEPGIYLYSLVVANKTIDTKKMIVMK